MKKNLAIFGLILGIVLAHSAVAADKPAVKPNESKSAKAVRQAQVLVQTGKFADAFALLQPLEFELSGDVVFDYLLGISAVNAGKPDRATLALERVEAVAPEYGEVRLWLGIAYFQSGDMDRAKKSLTGLLRQAKISTQSKNTANQYLTVIKQQDETRLAEAKKAKQPSLLGAIEFGLGNDSNITSGPKNYVDAYTTSFSAPPQPPLPPSNISARFAQINGNVEGRIPFSSAGNFAYASLDSNNRAYLKYAMMNSHANTVKGGVNLQSGMNTYRFDLSRRDYRQLGTAASQGYTGDSTQNSATGDARFALTERDYLAVSLQYNMPRYPTTNAQDTNQVVIGTNFTHVFEGTGSPMIYVALNHTRDKAVRQSLDMKGIDQTDVSRNTNAFIAYTQYTPVPSADVTAMWMLSMRRDSRAFARSNNEAFGNDDMQVMMLGVNWRPASDWLVKPQLLHIRNASNIPLYVFQKTEVSVSVKRDFK